MRLILHIGTEKTGTTTTQRWAARNRDALIAQGVYYSRVLGEVNHTRLYLWCLAPGKTDEGYDRLGISSQGELDGFRRRLPAEFSAEVEKAKSFACHTFLISNEHCHSRLNQPDEVRKVREFLEPHFGRIDILCSLRPQIDVAVSLASTAARTAGRGSRSSFDRVKPGKPYYNYMSLVDRWSMVFGADRVILVPFRRMPSLPDYLIAQARLDALSLQPPTRLNQALGIGVMAMINAMDRDRSWESRRADSFAQIPFGLLELLPHSQRLQPGLKLARGIQARFADSNSRLVQSRGDIEAADLEPDWSRYDCPDNLAMLEQPCAFGDQLCALVKIFNQQLALARAEKEIARAECDIAKQHPVLAERRLKMAECLLGQLDKAALPGQKLASLRERALSLGGMLSGASEGDRKRAASSVHKRGSNPVLARVEKKMAEAERGIADERPAMAERRLKAAERLLAQLDKAGVPDRKIALLHERAESLAGILARASAADRP